jgi:hypothetical protein
MAYLRKKYHCGQSRKPKDGANPRTSPIKHYQIDKDIISVGRYPYKTPPAKPSR